MASLCVWAAPLQVFDGFYCDCHKTIFINNIMIVKIVIRNGVSRAGHQHKWEAFVNRSLSQ